MTLARPGNRLHPPRRRPYYGAPITPRGDVRAPVRDLPVAPLSYNALWKAFDSIVRRIASPAIAAS
ncbi:MAG TPA: hypothetical protein VJN39_00640 [Gemmatimonadales bacterium]|nr:hypothetical protein [Gemmatimonadales bacterium]